jgi:hypothetical protein
MTIQLSVMSGAIEPLAPGFDSTGVIAVYLKKFSFVRDFFQSHRQLSLEAFAKRFSVRFYLFRPEMILYTEMILYLDNQVKFCFRIEVRL